MAHDPPLRGALRATIPRLLRAGGAEAVRPARAISSTACKRLNDCAAAMHHLRATEEQAVATSGRRPSGIRAPCQRPIALLQAPPRVSHPPCGHYTAAI